ncbi:hypothetical protein XOC_0194 [Xanthomonas oryzae pv. oryzicola BLS256]|uniref:Uncharacterized protein n=1 Tax=Xanthomonas oryzae pv. oryzicola (strain BLS256) TaxID=383407 RepID=G7TJP0_XANOB|nr:hypothetical protein XOC_0194 [Xanthomonas oryzae pv. oryzicola BLS256]QEO99779.1 hypothetical protein XOCgx_4792 [Xanthomonas oryzae pv. oryzicola]
MRLRPDDPVANALIALVHSRQPHAASKVWLGRIFKRTQWTRSSAA